MTTQADKDSPSDEEMRKLLKPKPTGAQIIDILKKNYVDKTDPPTSVEVVRELESYDDHNFWVRIGDTDYLAKVHNGVESKDLIDCVKVGKFESSVIHLQNTMMTELSSHGVVTSGPQSPRHSQDGDDAAKEDSSEYPSRLPTPGSIHPLPVMSEAHSPCPLVVRLLAWVPGNPMASYPVLPIESLADCGRYLGRLSKTLDASVDTNQLTAAKRYHQWDGKNTMDLKDWTKYIQDDRKRSMIESILQAFDQDLIQSGDAGKFPTGLIHGDCNDANVLLDDKLRVSGVIDFGDSVESWRVLDLTVAMAYASLSAYGKYGRCISAAAAFLRGYCTVNPISELERKHLVLLMAARLACSCTLGNYSYQQNPGNEYLLLHAKPAWDALDLIWGTDPDRRTRVTSVIHNIFAQACDKAPSDTPGIEVINCADLSFSDPQFLDPLEPLRDASTEPASKRAKCD